MPLYFLCDQHMILSLRHVPLYVVWNGEHEITRIQYGNGTKYSIIAASVGRFSKSVTFEKNLIFVVKTSSSLESYFLHSSNYNLVLITITDHCLRLNNQKRQKQLPHSK